MHLYARIRDEFARSSREFATDTAYVTRVRGTRGSAVFIHVCDNCWKLFKFHTTLNSVINILLTPFPRRGSSSEPSMDVGALGRPPGVPPGGGRLYSGTW